MVERVTRAAAVAAIVCAAAGTCASAAETGEYPGKPVPGMTSLGAVILA